MLDNWKDLIRPKLEVRELDERFGRLELEPFERGFGTPIGTSLRRILGLDTILMGFGLDDGQIHSPNEKFEQTCFHRGIRSHIRLLGKLAGVA